METGEWQLFLLHTARGRMLLLAGLMVLFLLGLHAYRRTLDHPYPRLARVLLVFACIVAIAILLDLFGLFDLLFSK